MVEIYRFAAVRPGKNAAQEIASVPYDVVTAPEAALCIRENPDSFLRVSRPDAELPDLAPDDDRVYARARENFQRMLDSGRLERDRMPSLYIYRVIGPDIVYCGLACCLSTTDYEENTIRKHELTRYDKEEDRTRHIDAVNAHTGPVVLLYRNGGDISGLLESIAAGRAVPDTEVRWTDGTVHQVFCIDDAGTLSRVEALFRGIDALYIADGHHRAKSATNVAARRQDRGTATGESKRFLGVLFAHDGVRIHGYSRLVTDLGGLAPGEFIERLGRYYDVSPCGPVDVNRFHIPAREGVPAGCHVVHMYLGGIWYECVSPALPDAGIIESLDVSILQKEVLLGILGISDPRGDSRLQYLGGAHPIADLQARVDSGEFVVAFAMQPVQVETVLDIADTGVIMPPKSTWFEPKLLSGLLVHTLD
jgi:uncharacterized protein (DUF1015 family)